MKDYLELTKPRITLLILVCTAVGYWFGCGVSFHWKILAHALLGTALLASPAAGRKPRPTFSPEESMI